MANIRKYPTQIVLMVSTEVGELIDTLATEQELHKTEVTRAFLHAGIRRAGYADIITADKREIPLPVLAPAAEAQASTGPVETVVKRDSNGHPIGSQQGQFLDH